MQFSKFLWEGFVPPNMGRYIAFLLFLFVRNVHAQTLIDSVIAAVNGEAITQSELENECRIATLIGTWERGVTPNTAGPTVSEKREALDAIIARKFVLQEAERLGILLTDRSTQVTAQIAEIRSKYATETAFYTVLQKHELAIEALEKWVYDRLIYDVFFRRKFFNTVNSEEITQLAAQYFEKHKTEFIVTASVTFHALRIAVPPDASAKEKRRAEALAQQLNLRLQQGATFEAVKQTYKAEPFISLNASTLPADTPLGTIIAQLQVAERSKPLPVSYGYLIAELIKKTPARQKQYPEVKDEIVARIRQQNAKGEFDTWLTQRKSEGNWYILDDELAQFSQTKTQPGE